MSLRILLAGSDPVLADAVAVSLNGLADTVVIRAGSDQGLLETIAAAAPDVIILDAARLDRDGMDAIRLVIREHPRPIVMFVDAEDPAMMEAAIAAGVGSHNIVSTALPCLKPIVRTAVAFFRRYRRVEEELAAVRDSLEESVVIGKAKARLIRERHLSEPEAYRFLQRRAMNEGRRIAHIARAILEKERAC